MKTLLLVSALLVLIVTIGVIMKTQIKTTSNLEKFDDLWNLGDPVPVEKKFHELLPQAKALQDKSIYLQIMSQIALAQAMQKQFDAAHKTLDEAEAMLKPEYDLAKARILLERGRVFHQMALQSGNNETIPQAKSFWEKSFNLCVERNFDFHAINAAHMIAIIATTPEEKIAWNQRAITMAEQAKETRAQMWFGSLYNNLGQNYLETKQFDQALSAFQKALEYRKKEGYAPNVRVAEWAIARTQRFLNHLDEALTLNTELLKEYADIKQSGQLDMPAEMFTLTRGWVYEELTEIYLAKAKTFAKLAYNDLSMDEMFRKTSAERLERLKEIKES